MKTHSFPCSSIFPFFLAVKIWSFPLLWKVILFGDKLVWLDLAICQVFARRSGWQKQQRQRDGSFVKLIGIGRERLVVLPLFQELFVPPAVAHVDKAFLQFTCWYWRGFPKCFRLKLWVGFSFLPSKDIFYNSDVNWGSFAILAMFSSLTLFLSRRSSGHV